MKRNLMTESNIINSLCENKEVQNRFMDLIKNYPNDFFNRDNMNGHITGSMLVLNEDGSKVLLTHHKKLGKWLQLGGHNDSVDNTILETAIKEMEEEAFSDKRTPHFLLSHHPLDLDIHSVGTHNHYDICFACVVSENETVDCSFESNDVQWIEVEKILNSNSYDERLVRMVKSAQKLVPQKNKTLKY